MPAKIEKARFIGFIERRKDFCTKGILNNQLENLIKSAQWAENILQTT